MFKTLTVVFLTLFAMSSHAIDKYDFFVDKGLPCADRKVIEQKLYEGGWVATIKIQQPSKGWWTYVYFQEDKNIRGRVKNMMIFEYEPTGNTACLLSESSGSVWFNSQFWKKFHIGGGMEIWEKRIDNANLAMSRAQDKDMKNYWKRVLKVLLRRSKTKLN